MYEQKYYTLFIILKNQIKNNHIYSCAFYIAYKSLTLLRRNKKIGKANKLEYLKSLQMY